MISSIFFPGPFEPDFRPIIILISAMAFFIAYVIRKNWDYIQDEFNNDWEK